MRTLARRTFALLLLFATAHCSGGKGGSIAGNPAIRVDVKLSQTSVGGGGVSDLKICVANVRFYPSDGSAPVAVAVNLDATVSASGTTLIAADLPTQIYSRVELDMANTCLLQGSVQVVNANGLFATSAQVTSAFTGEFPVTATAKAIQLQFEPVVTQLASVNSNSQITAAIASPGLSANLLDEFTWTGAGSDGNWSSGANWYGGIVPGSGDTAIFNGACSSNCSPAIGSSISVAGIQMLTGYAGTISQGAGASISVAGGGWKQSAGTFSGGSSSITLSNGGGITLTGGTFTSTSGVLRIDSGTVGGNLTALDVSGGSFLHNSGTVVFSSSADAAITVNAAGPLALWAVSFFVTASSGPAPTVTYLLAGGSPYVPWDFYGAFELGQAGSEGSISLQAATSDGREIRLSGDVSVLAGASSATNIQFAFAGAATTSYSQQAGAYLSSADVTLPKVGAVNLLTDLILPAQTQVLNVGNTAVLSMQGHRVSTWTVLNNGVINEGGGSLQYTTYSGSGTLNP